MLTKILKMKGSKYCVQSGQLVQILFHFLHFKYVLNGSFMPSFPFSLSYPFLMLKGIDAVKCSYC